MDRYHNKNTSRMYKTLRSIPPRQRRQNLISPEPPKFYKSTRMVNKRALEAREKMQVYQGFEYPWIVYVLTRYDVLRVMIVTTMCNVE